MTNELFKNATILAREIISRKIKEGNVVVDATVGNGHDTLFLANKVGSTGKVYGFDIQKIAIDNTRKKLKKNNVLDRVMLFNDGHENLFKYVEEEVDLVVFNLGYLPGGNHEIITQPSTTISATKKSLTKIKKNGIIIITVYHGHEGGKIEKDYIESFLSGLNQKEFNVIKMNLINQVNYPPILFAIEKI